MRSFRYLHLTRTKPNGLSNTQMLLRSILARFELAVAHTEALVSRYRSAARPPAFDPETIPARRRFLAKRVKLLQNLMRWRKHTGDRFGVGSLATRLVDLCIVDIAQDGWEVGGDEFARRVRIIYSSNLTFKITVYCQAASILSIELLPARLRGAL